MRIVGGRWRGTALAALGAGDDRARLRPTTDRVRESIFNLLAHGGHGDVVSGARVLDLFAGTGALGLEALSRGAAHVTFVENGRTARDLIRSNVDRLRAQEMTRLLPRSALRPGPAAEPCSLIFLDPPYGKGLGERGLAAAMGTGWIAPRAIVVWEEARALPPPPGFASLDARSYGQTSVMLLQAQG